MARLPLLAFLLAALVTLPVGAEIPLEEDCVIGASQSAHGLTAADADARIRQYANLYVRSYASYNREKSDMRRTASSYMELDGWTQNDVVGFTRAQRELLYISVAGELAVGKIGTDELPGYVEAIDRKIVEIEADLGCQNPS